jgi:hypothetical protein
LVAEAVHEQISCHIISAALLSHSATGEKGVAGSERRGDKTAPRKLITFP